jgi:chemotaxis signal transduction protein
MDGAVTSGLLDSPAAVRACVVRLGGEPFALDVRSTVEVVVLDDITPVPRAAAHVLGVANLRGKVMPIVDARPVLGLSGDRPGRSGVTGLVVRAGAWHVAVLVDAVEGLEAFADVSPLPEGARERFGRLAVGRLQRGADDVTLLDATALLEALRTGGRPSAPGQGEAASGVI